MVYIANGRINIKKINNFEIYDNDIFFFCFFYFDIIKM